MTGLPIIEQVFFKFVCVNSLPGSQQCIVTISCDSGWTGIPDVRFDEAGTSGDGGGDDDEDGISFLQLFTVSSVFRLIFIDRGPSLHFVWLT